MVNFNSIPSHQLQIGKVKCEVDVPPLSYHKETHTTQCLIVFASKMSKKEFLKYQKKHNKKVIQLGDIFYKRVRLRNLRHTQAVAFYGEIDISATDKYEQDQLLEMFGEDFVKQHEEGFYG